MIHLTKKFTKKSISKHCCLLTVKNKINFPSPFFAGYSAKEHTPTYRGFDTFLGSYTSGVDHFTHERSYEEMTGVDFHDNVGTNLRCTSQFYGQHSTDVLSNRAVNIITSHNFQEAPLFVYLSFQV